MPDRSDRRSGEDPTPAPVSEGAPPLAAGWPLTAPATIAKWGGTSEMHALFLMDGKLVHALEEIARLSSENARLTAERDELSHGMNEWLELVEDTSRALGEGPYDSIAKHAAAIVAENARLEAHVSRLEAVNAMHLETIRVWSPRPRAESGDPR